MKLLVVDDSKTMRMLIIRGLKQAGFDDLTILQAENGVAALEIVEAENPGVIISDWNMPEMNGIDFLKELRRRGHENTFGFITTEGTDCVQAEAKEFGASFFITKPFTPEKLECALTPVIH